MSASMTMLLMLGVDVFIGNLLNKVTLWPRLASSRKSGWNGTEWLLPAEGKNARMFELWTAVGHVIASRTNKTNAL